MVRKAFGVVLRNLREGKKISQEKLAELTSTDRITIYRFENGLMQPTLDSIFKLSIALDIKPSEFLALVEEELKNTPPEIV